MTGELQRCRDEVARLRSERDEARQRLTHLQRQLSRLLLDVRTLFDLPRQMHGAGGDTGVLQCLVYTVSGQFLLDDVLAYWRGDGDGTFQLEARAALVEPSPPAELEVAPAWLEGLGGVETAIPAREIPPGAISPPLADSNVLVPLSRAGQVQGFLILDTELRPGLLNEESVSLLYALCDQAVLAIQNVELLRRTQEQRRELAERNRALAAANARLMELDRIKQDIIDRTLHEFNTPLTAIVGYVQLLKIRWAKDLSPQLQRVIGVIERSTDRLVHNVSEIAAGSRLEESPSSQALVRRHLVPATLVRDAVEMVEMIATDRDVTIMVDLPEPQGTIEGDPRSLRQVFDELLQNALRFTPDGGTVWVEAIPWTEGTADWVLTVKDTGIGIDPGDQAVIFERFESAMQLNTHSSGTYEYLSGGLGLGLWVVRRIIQRHGGEITVESAPGEGATFRVRLPGYGPPSDSVMPPAPTP